MHAKLEKDDFLFGNDFRIVGLLYNPIVSTTSGIAIGTKQLNLTTKLASDLDGFYDDAKIEGDTSGATGRIVHYETNGVTVGGIHTIYYTQENELGYGLKSDGTKPNFVAGENITLTEGGLGAAESRQIDTNASTASKRIRTDKRFW